ncbi:MAG TPA: ATP-dependent DNA helicase UvrD2 [Acidimicrobiales bacterium]|nr:ATP-dependent DNA helicase UvrD2 [Acidimicrobiales bacterium]
MPAPGPALLGRGVVVTAGSPPPPPWEGAPVVTLDDAGLADPAAVVGALHDAWLARRPLVVELAVDPVHFRTPETWEVEPWRLDPRFEAWSDRLHFLVWANTYDARAGDPVWWWGRKAARLGATETPDGPADLLLPDGTAAWVDGGPRGPLDTAVLGAAVVHRESVDLGSLATAPAPCLPAADLAPDQLAAVAHGAGPARIVAPAGSGKTRVLTERVRHLMVDRGLERSTVLAVAYNKRAQLELEARTTDVGPRADTLNALGYRLVTEHLGRQPRVLDEREVRRLVDEVVPKRRRLANTDPTAPYLEGLTAIRLGLRDPDEVEDERDDVPGLAGAFRPYRRALAAAGAVDFDEQVYGAVEALLRDGALRRRAQDRCRHLLVDELQDLTPAHLLLLRLLATPDLDVFGVGDDDQVIYGYSGADPGFLIDFAELFPGAASHPLTVNYRCPEPVVAAAKALLSYNHRRVPKEITAGPDAAAELAALDIDRHPPEVGARRLVETVEAWLADGATTAEVAVLARVNSLLLAPHVALSTAGIAITSTLGPEVLERTGVRAALAYLRIAAEPSAIDPADVVEVYRRPSRGLPNWFPKWLRGRLDVGELRRIAAKIDDAKVSDKVDSLVDDIELVIDAAHGGATTRELLGVVKDSVGLGGAMRLLDGSKGGQTASQLDDLEALEQVADLHPEAASFEPWLRSVLHRERADGGVTLSTIHRVKGMEWDHVAVFGVTDGLIPHRLADDVEEERRILHVAVTRGRRRVAVLGDAGRPSPFLDELTGSAPHRPAPLPRERSVIEPVTPKGRRRAEAVADLPPGDAAVEEALRAWRLERSRADGVAAFIVASNATLRAIAVARPSSLAGLARVPGIGPTKLEAYGDEILAILEALPALR